MRVCVCVCVCVCVRACVSVCVRACACVCVFIYVHILCTLALYVCPYIAVHAYVPLHKSSRLQARTTPHSHRLAAWLSLHLSSPWGNSRKVGVVDLQPWE